MVLKIVQKPISTAVAPVQVVLMVKVVQLLVIVEIKIVYRWYVMVSD